MTDALELARAVIAEDDALARSSDIGRSFTRAKNGDQVTLARALLSLHAECDRMRAVVEAARAWHSEQICSLRTPLTDAIEALDRTAKETP